MCLSRSWLDKKVGIITLLLTVCWIWDFWLARVLENQFRERLCRLVAVAMDLGRPPNSKKQHGWYMLKNVTMACCSCWISFVRLPIACPNTFSGANPSAEPRAFLVFSRVPMLLLARVNLNSADDYWARRAELQLEKLIEVFWRGPSSWREGQVCCWSSNKSATTNFKIFRVLLLSYFSICLKFGQSKALKSELCFFSFGNTYRMEHDLGITSLLLSILS